MENMLEDNKQPLGMKNSKIKAIKGMLFIKIVMVVMAVLTIATMTSTGDWLGILMNLLFLAGMAVMLERADRKSIQKLNETGEDCHKISGWLQEMYAAGMKDEILWDNMKQLEDSFRDDVFKERWEYYTNSEMSSNLSEYLDEDELLEIYEKNYCDMIPGLLTAMGILGTFLGLIFSISSFNLDNPNALEMALGNIVGGMNVAFYTSVYGVALSIIFNLVFKSCQRKFLLHFQELRSYVEIYFKGAVSGDTNRQLIEYSKIQQESLQKIREIMEADMAQEIGDKIGESIEPVFQEINKSLNRVIGDFRKEQSASLQSVVESFVEQMRYALDAHINELGESVDRLSFSQIQMSEEMRKLLAEIGRTAEDTKAVNRESAYILKKFEEYMDKINKMMEVANTTFISVENYSREMYKASVNQQNLVNMLAVHEKDLADAYHQVMTVHQQMTKATEDTLNIIYEMGKRDVAMSEQQKNLTDSLNKYAQGTMNIFSEMKASQLAAAVQYQESWKMLDKLVEQIKQAPQEQVEKQKPDYESKDMLALMQAQTYALYEMQQYIRNQEERREKKLINRLKIKLKRRSKKQS